VGDLVEYWEDHPPLQTLVQGLVGYKKETPIDASEVDLSELAGIAGIEITEEKT